MVVAGLKAPLALLLTESTSLGTEPGLMYHSLLKSSSTARLEEAVTEETLVEFTPLLRAMASLKKAAKTISLRTQNTSVVQTFRSARTALTLRVQNQETKVIAGLLLATLFGK